MNVTVEKINSLKISKASYFERGEVKQELLFAKFEKKDPREISGMILGKPGQGKRIRHGNAK